MGVHDGELEHECRHFSKLFEAEIEMLPSVAELFELQLAYLEYQCLPESEFWGRCAYFKTRNRVKTKHYKLFSNVSDALMDDRSPESKQYFEKGSYATGYATHGWFPYRGKFHPQLVKAILNIIGVQING